MDQWGSLWFLEGDDVEGEGQCFCYWGGAFSPGLQNRCHQLVVPREAVDLKCPRLPINVSQAPAMAPPSLASRPPCAIPAHGPWARQGWNRAEPPHSGSREQ